MNILNSPPTLTCLLQCLLSLMQEIGVFLCEEMEKPKRKKHWIVRFGARQAGSTWLANHEAYELTSLASSESFWIGLYVCVHLTLKWVKSQWWPDIWGKASKSQRKDMKIERIKLRKKWWYERKRKLRQTKTTLKTSMIYIVEIKKNATMKHEKVYLKSREQRNWESKNNIKILNNSIEI